MELHNPSNVALPALKIEKIRDRQIMEEDSSIHSLIDSNLLLDPEFNRLYLDLLKKSKELLRAISLKENELYREYVLQHRVSLGHNRFILYQMMRHEISERLPRKRKKEIDEAIFKLKKEVYTAVQKKVVKLSNEIQDSISDFEERRHIDLSILSSTTVHVCKDCAKIISLNKFKRCICTCGKKISDISQVKRIPINHFNDKLIRFLEMNYWLEHGVDYLLRRKNFQTLVGYHVLGHSGVWHEIDNIADSRSENYRVFCECKNAEVTVNDIFVFFGKMNDIGCTRGYVFTTSKDVSVEIARLARSKNIDIVSDVLTREVQSLLKDIREG
ncbi:MAG: hypothetical protein WC974_00065 [Thermoplasmata archaeon]